MTYVTDLINEGNWLGLLFVAAVLAYIGQAMVQNRPMTKPWGPRIAAVVFILFAVSRALQYGEPATSDLISAVLHGLLAAALVVGPAWIVLAIVRFSYEHYRNLTSAARARAQTRRSDREQRRQQRDQRRAEQESQRRTPEQEQAEREAAELRRLNAERAADNAQRREDAIAACELLYHLRAPDIGERFPREQLDEFVKKYMGADKTIEVVERRAGDLQQVIQQHYESVNPPTRFKDLSELTSWFEQQREQIQSLSVADIYRQDFLVQLNQRYADLTQQVLEKL